VVAAQDTGLLTCSDQPQAFPELEWRGDEVDTGWQEDGPAVTGYGVDRGLDGLGVVGASVGGGAEGSYIEPRAWSVDENTASEGLVSRLCDRTGGGGS
jgi:hypothetical protein